MNIIVGSHVWVEDPDQAWIDGQVTKITGQEAEIETPDLKKVGSSYFILKTIFMLLLMTDYSICALSYE